MLEFMLCAIVVITILNLVLALSTSMVLIKIYEINKAQEDRYQMEEEAKRQARGLADITTPQIPYDLRR